MRIGVAAGLVLWLAGSGSVGAQTADLQEMAETRLALARLSRGVRVAESVRVLAEAAVEEPARQVQRTGEVLRRLFDRLAARAGSPGRINEKSQRRVDPCLSLSP